MSDYSQVNDYSAKDALTTGNPAKLIKGSDIDAELSAISVAIATKFDDTKIASEAEAQAETLNTKVITPLRLGQWADANGGIVGDLQALSDPNADRILFWDDSAGAAAALAATPATGGIGISSTDLVLDIDALTNVTPASGDELVVADASDSGNPKAVLLSALATLFETDMNHDNLTGFVANEHIDHTSVSISAGTGLTGGGTIASNRTISLSHLGIQSLTDPNADRILFWDDSAGATAWLEASTGLSLSNTTIAVDVASSAETDTGTSTTKVMVPGNFGQTSSLGVDAVVGSSASRGATGYYVLPGGLTLQWGTVTSVGANSSKSVTFPRAFTEVYSMQLTLISTDISIGDHAANVEGVGTTGATVYNGNAAINDYYWFAVGIS